MAATIDRDSVTGIAVYPGRAGSVHLTRLPRLAPGPGQALVRVRRVGVCGTDREIIHAHFGTPPPGSDELVLGHEVLGVVEAVADGVQAVRTGDLVTVTSSDDVEHTKPARDVFAAALNKIAPVEPADCIVVGATGLTRVERLLLGSVSSSLAAQAHCSVEIVRA